MAAEVAVAGANAITAASRKTTLSKLRAIKSAQCHMTPQPNLLATIRQLKT
jgi:hypothetical protein